MLSKEFLNERGRNGSSDDEPAAAPAQTPDWLKNAGKYISNKIGLKEPVALPDYTASNQQDAAVKSGYTGIDPVQRQRAGMAPATQQEINRYMKDNPAVVGGLTDRNGNPIASGGAQEVERAARAAAPRRGADFDADAEVGEVDPAVIGNRFKTPNELGFQPGGSTAPTPAPAAPAPAAAVPAAAPAPSVQTSPVPSSKIQATPLPAPKAFSEPAAAAGAAPAPMKGGYGSGMNNPSVAPKTAAAATDDGPEQLGYSPDELEQMKKNAGLPKTEKAINPETGEEYDKLATAQSANDGNAGEAQAAAGDAPAANPMSQDPAQQAQRAATTETAELNRILRLSGMELISEGSTKSITVQRGDTLGKIARDNSTTVDAIVKLNAIANPDRIYPGDVIRIPTGQVAVPGGRTKRQGSTRIPDRAEKLTTTTSTGNPKIAMEFFLDQGWTPEQAAGLVANLQAESYDHIDPAAENSGAYGIAQWRGSRKRDFEQEMGRPIKGSSLIDQLKFVQHELNNKEAKAGRLLKQATTAAEAAEIVDEFYERSGGAAIRRRIALANSLLTAFA